MTVSTRPASALVRACHPLPTVAVTLFTAALGLGAGLDVGRTLLLVAAVLTGQLSIGWLNDAVDADLDRAGGRTDKPVAGGEIARRTVATAAVLAAAVTVPLSLALGLLSGVLHLLVVASGWAYDLALKGTVASPLPYLVAFGALPAVPATAAGGGLPWLLMASAGLLAVGAHFANTVPDAEVDAATGVRGLPQRIGPRRSQWCAAAGVVAASAVLLVGAGAELGVVAVLLLAVAALLGAASPLLPPHWSFRTVLGAAAAAVAGVVASGPALLG